MNNEELKLLRVILVLGCLILGFLIGLGVGKTKYQNIAIERGYAQYNGTNGAFEWKAVK
jgi:hypothetical protein